MRRHLALIGPAALALLFSACGTDLPTLPGQLAGNGNAKGESMAASADMMMRANVRYELADGVRVDATTGKAYQLGDATQADAERLAKAFGVKGPVRKEQDGWTAGQSGKEEVTTTGGALYVSKSGGSFSMYWSYPLSGGGCSVEPSGPVTEPAPDLPPDAAVASDDIASRPACAEVPPSATTTLPPGTAPTKAEAQSIATKALKDGGVDLDDVKVTSETLDDRGFNVRFQPTFDGHVAEGFEAFVTVGPTKEITGANGYVGSLKSLGSYDLATLQRAVDRLNETSVYPLAADGRESLVDKDATLVAPADSGASSGDAGTTPSYEEPAEPIVVKLTKAEVGVMLLGDSKGALWLVPSYDFTAENGDRVVAAAADDKYIEKPSTDTTGVQTDPGSGGGSGGGSDGNTGSGVVDPAPPSNCASTNEPIAATVCSDKSSYKADESVVFTITASDPDRAFTAGPCGDGVGAEYGDNGEGDVRCLACSTTVADGPGKLSLQRAHKYAKAGTYTANFTIKSGAECGEPHPNDSQVVVPLKVTVT